MSVSKSKIRKAVDDPFADGERVRRILEGAFAEAAREAVAENDRLGIVTHGAVEGRLVERRPAGNKAAAAVGGKR